MKKLSLLAAVVLTVSGCASVRNQPIEPKAVESLKGQTLTYAKREAKPDFAAMTPAKAALGVFGVASIISTGNEIIATNNVPDPADAIAAGLAEALGTAHGVKVGAAVAVKGNEIDDLIQKAGGAKYFIDVETINWSLVYFPTSWGTYRVIYGGKARLIDASTKDVVAEGFCSRVPEQQADSPSYDELLADDAKRLKSELATAAAECLAQFKRDTLKL